MNCLFDITKKYENWLSSQDRNFYSFQIETNGKVGYRKTKPAPQNTIHLFKHLKSISASISTSETKDKFETLSMSSGDYNDDKEDLVLKEVLQVKLNQDITKLIQLLVL